jgi:hypothetical protein
LALPRWGRLHLQAAFFICEDDARATHAGKFYAQKQNVFDTQLAHSDSVANARIDARFASWLRAPRFTREMESQVTKSQNRASGERKG